jgi:hypothetical protein
MINTKLNSVKHFSIILLRFTLFSLVIMHQLSILPQNESSLAYSQDDHQISSSTPSHKAIKEKKSHRKHKKNLDDSPSVIHKIVMYVPNRIFDVLDIARARVKVGPGFGAGVQLTKYGQVYLGSQVAVYAGLPGPRQHPTLPIPIGIETRSGVALSVVDATISTDVAGPMYSSSEIGLNLHLAFIGVDVTLDPVEVLDAITGLVMVDIRDDSL